MPAPRIKVLYRCDHCAYVGYSIDSKSPEEYLAGLQQATSDELSASNDDVLPR